VTTTTYPTVPARRTSDEFADALPLLRRMAALPPGCPERRELRDALIVRFLPVAERIAARQSSSTPWAREDLRQVASEAVIGAVDRWDPDRARGDFLGYLVPCVRGEVLRFFRDQSWSMRVPRRLKDLTVAIRRTVPTLSQRLGRAPRPSELARELDVDVEEVLEALQAEDSHHTLALDAPGPDQETPTVDHLGVDDDRLELAEDLTSLRPLLARLPDRERRILLLRFYGDRTQTQIAEELGISQMHVSRLLAQTLARLRRELAAD
jgi:RNA polymerase sigma-B factor